MNLTLCQLQMRLKISQADIHSPQCLLGVVLRGNLAIRDNLAHHYRSVIKARHRKTASSALNSHHCCWSYYILYSLLDQNTTELCFFIIGIHTKISSVSRFLVAFNQDAKGAYLTSSRRSACIRAAPTGRIWVKFDIGSFYENLLRNSKFG